MTQTTKTRKAPSKNPKVGRSRSETADAPVSVGLRIPGKLLKIARARYVNGGERPLALCQRLLEERLLELRPTADEYLRAWANGEALPSFVDYSLEGQKLDGKITLKLSAEAYKVARSFSLGEGSVPKVCEPILAAALEARTKEAIKIMEDTIKELTRE